MLIHLSADKENEMIHPLETRLMTDPLPHVQSVGLFKTVDGLNQPDRTADYTSKDSGGNQYYAPDSEPYRSDPDKAFYDELKQKYKRTTELQLRKTQRIRTLLREYGPEMFYLMADYWNNKPVA
ncbi:MAG: hypothetical protein JXA66_03630 [Oligoflexia bacterium]|nr:hypothetical protein [Oligoflexia bacterium]